MTTKQLQYIGPHAEIELAATGDLVERDDIVDVPAEIAGRAPAARLAGALDDLAAAVTAAAEADLDVDEQITRARAVAELRAEIAGLDHGEGLLAQPDNWKLVAAFAGTKSTDEEQ